MFILTNIKHSQSSNYHKRWIYNLNASRIYVSMTHSSYQLLDQWYHKILWSNKVFYPNFTDKAKSILYIHLFEGRLHTISIHTQTILRGERQISPWVDWSKSSILPHKPVVIIVSIRIWDHLTFILTYIYCSLSSLNEVALMTYI